MPFQTNIRIPYCKSLVWRDVQTPTQLIQALGLLGSMRDDQSLSQEVPRYFGKVHEKSRRTKFLRQSSDLYSPWSKRLLEMTPKVFIVMTSKNLDFLCYYCLLISILGRFFLVIGLIAKRRNVTIVFGRRAAAKVSESLKPRPFTGKQSEIN